jgi:diacylglycerol kinase family enzyme
MAKEQITEWLLTNSKQVKEVLLFIFIVTMGAIAKMINAVRKGTKFTFSWLISELIMSFFVAITVYAVFDQFLEVNKFFSFTMCAWSGTFSTTFQEKGKELVTAIFDYLKIWIKTKLT